MTCIVGLVDNGDVYIGGDSAGVGGYSITIRADEKVFLNSGFVFGFTTSFRMGQLIQYAFEPPGIKVKQDVFAYMVTDFIDGLRECFKKGGWGMTENNKNWNGAEMGGTFLVGYAGRLLKIQDDFQVSEAQLPFDATGCGQDLALGSLYSTEGGKPKERLTRALQAAECFSAGVHGPFVIKKLGAK